MSFALFLRSRDDWFILYSAIHSRAYVLTSDILRKERGISNKSSPAKDSQVNDTLQKWLYRYQYMFVRQGNRVYFKVISRNFSILRIFIYLNNFSHPWRIN